MLTLAAESLCLLLFPFYWHHILIPVLPSKLVGYLQAPVPYIVGMHRDYFMDDNLGEENTIPDDVREISFPIFV